MWISDLQKALKTLFHYYGYIELVEKIENNVITMGNGAKYVIYNNGQIKKVE
jgi:uncharacterized protein YlzI (FlbEa/FlbD family)